MSEDWHLAGSAPLPLSELPYAVNELIKSGNDLDVWLLKGEMGAGKTTLAKEVVKQLGVVAAVASPTFSIVNQYGNEMGKQIYHFDLYRLKNESEAFDIGLEEYLNSGNRCLIEWPEKLDHLMPQKYFEVQIEIYDSLRRKIYYRRYDGQA